MKPQALFIGHILSSSRPALTALCLSALLFNPSYSQEAGAARSSSPTSATAAATGEAATPASSGQAATPATRSAQAEAPARAGRSSEGRRQSSEAEAKQGSTRIVAAHPVVYGLLEALTQGSDIAAVRATPAKLPPSRHYSYLSGRGAKAFDRAIANADAVVDLRSIWSDDPLYPLGRQHNIRVIEIDAANPIDHRLPGIAATAGAGSIEAYPWLNPVNMGRMADIIASDIQRLQPESSDVVEKNLAALRQRLVNVNAQAESGLLEADSLSVIVLSPRLETLANAFNLDIVPVKMEKDPDVAAIEQLKKAIADNDVKVVLLHEKAADNVNGAITEAGAKALVVETDGDDPLAMLEAAGKTVVGALSGQDS